MLDTYFQIKARLLQLHEESALDHAIKLDAIPALDGQPPTELLAKMQQLCPPGEGKILLFCIAFVR